MCQAALSFAEYLECRSCVDHKDEETDKTVLGLNQPDIMCSDYAV